LTHRDSVIVGRRTAGSSLTDSFEFTAVHLRQSVDGRKPPAEHAALHDGDSREKQAQKGFAEKGHISSIRGTTLLYEQCV
jgi:hypothetical protein